MNGWMDLKVQKSHVEGSVQFLGQFRDLDFEAVLDIQQDAFVASSFFVFFLVSSDEVDG